ncbi:MAG: hypothetical protein RLZZ338_3821 [Cyanobacteriota bacterium]|jgi:hypothetical protein
MAQSTDTKISLSRANAHRAEGFIQEDRKELADRKIRVILGK